MTTLRLFHILQAGVCSRNLDVCLCLYAGMEGVFVNPSRLARAKARKVPNEANVALYARRMAGLSSFKAVGHAYYR